MVRACVCVYVCLYGLMHLLNEHVILLSFLYSSTTDDSAPSSPPLLRQYTANADPKQL